MGKEFISPKGLIKPVGYSLAVRAGDTIYLAGIVGEDEQGEIVEGNFEAQIVKAFEGVQLILEAARASLKDVVKLTVYLKNKDDVNKYNEVRDRFFAPPLPAATVVEVSRLSPGVLVEVEAIAVTD